MKKADEMTSEEKIERAVEIFEAATRATCDWWTEGMIELHKNDIREKLPFVFRMWMVDENGYLVAFLALRRTYIDMLYVHPDYFGKGYGSRLLKQAVEVYHAETLLCIRTPDERVFEFYKKRGFVVDREMREEETDCPTPYPLLFMRLEKPVQRVEKLEGELDEYIELLKYGDCSLEKKWNYLETCEVFGLIKEEMVIGIMVVNQEGRIVNLAVYPDFQCQFYGTYLVHCVIDYYQNKFRWLTVAISGDKVPYFKRFQFTRQRTVKDFYRWKYPRSRRKHRKRYDPWDLVYMRVRIGK